MLLPLDHVPFYGEGDIALKGFQELGFRVSPLGAYTSPEFPEARWPTNCVFLEQGWFDLLRGDGLDSVKVARPSGCLFLTDDIENAKQRLRSMSVASSYSLVRAWDNVAGPTERFQLIAYKQSLCQLPLAVIEHHWPCDDIEPSWVAHPNGALRLEGVICSVALGKKPVLPDTYGDVINTGQAADLAVEEFRNRFKTDELRFAVSIRVLSLGAVKTLLKDTAVPTILRSSALLAFPAALGCVFEFFE